MRKLSAIIIGKGSISLCSLLLLRVYSHNLSLSEIGIITLLQNIDTFFGFVYASSYGNYLALTALSDQRNNVLLQKMYEYALLSFCVIALFIPVVIGYVGWMGVSLSIGSQLLYIAFLYLFHVGGILPSQLTVLNRVESSIMLQVFKAVCAIIASAVAFKFMKGISGWIAGLFTGSIITGIVFFYYNFKSFGKMPLRLRTLSHLFSIKPVIKFILPFAILQASIWIFFNGYRVFAPGFFNLELIGMLGLAFTFAAQFCFAFESILTQLFQADFYRLIDESNEKLKLAHFGTFLKLANPVYLSFYVLGFIPYLVVFSFIVKAQTPVHFSVLVFAWVFNCFRLQLNLLGLITSVLANPRFLLRYIAFGLLLLVLSIAVFKLLELPLSERSFLFLLNGAGSLVLITASLKIATLTGNKRLKVYTTAVCLGLLAGGLSLSHYQRPGIDANLIVIVLTVSALCGLLLAFQLLTLPKKLTLIGAQ